MSEHSRYQALAEALYDALEEADERDPAGINGDQFLAKLPIADIAGLAVTCLVEGRLFELRAIWNFIDRQSLEVRPAADRARSFLASLDVAILNQADGVEQMTDLVMAFEVPGNFDDAIPLARSLAAEVLAARSPEDQASVLAELAIEGGRGLQRAAGAIIRIFEEKPSSAHAAMARLDLTTRAIEAAQMNRQLFPRNSVPRPLRRVFRTRIFRPKIFLAKRFPEPE